MGSFSGDCCRKLYSIKGTPEIVGGLSLNTVLLHQFEQSYSAGGASLSQHSQEMSMAPTKTLNMLYCISGNRFSLGKLPDIKTAFAASYGPNAGKFSKEVWNA